MLPQLPKKVTKRNTLQATNEPNKWQPVVDPKQFLPFRVTENFYIFEIEKVMFTTTWRSRNGVSPMAINIFVDCLYDFMSFYILVSRMSAGKCLQSIMISQAAKSRCKCRDRSPGVLGLLLLVAWWKLWQHGWRAKNGRGNCICV